MLYPTELRAPAVEPLATPATAPVHRLNRAAWQGELRMLRARVRLLRTQNGLKTDSPFFASVDLSWSPGVKKTVQGWNVVSTCFRWGHPRLCRHGFKRIVPT